MDTFTNYCAKNGIDFSFSKVTIPSIGNAYNALNKADSSVILTLRFGDM